MATKFETVEAAFRLGSGRYIQENGAITCLGDELNLIDCSAPLIITGKTAWTLTKDKIQEALDNIGIEFRFYEYSGYCNEEKCDEIIGMEASAHKFDSVVGVGGGNVMDAAKLIAAKRGIPVINIPTSSATCAAYTPLSVMYDAVGRTVGTRHHRKEVNAVLADMDILCRQPVRLLVSGIYDSLAKFIETKQRMLGKEKEDTNMGVMSSFLLSNFIYDELLRLLPEASEDVKNGKNTACVYNAVYIIIAITGLISGLARGSNQCAIAHKIYETTRILFPAESRPYLHGEIVALGLLPQLIYNGEAEKEKNFRNQMRKLGVPTRFRDIGVDADDEILKKYCEIIMASSLMEDTTEEEHEALYRAMHCIL